MAETDPINILKKTDERRQRHKLHRSQDLGDFLQTPPDLYDWPGHPKRGRQTWGMRLEGQCREPLITGATHVSPGLPDLTPGHSAGVEEESRVHLLTLPQLPTV